MDEVVALYETAKPFFIDGVPVQRDNLERIKIVQQGPSFDTDLKALLFDVQLPQNSGRRVPPEQVPARLDALFRTGATDVTSYAVRAFAGAKPGKVLTPEFFKIAAELFVAGLKAFSGG